MGTEVVVGPEVVVGTEGVVGPEVVVGPGGRAVVVLHRSGTVVGIPLQLLGLCCKLIQALIFPQ